MNTLLFVDLPLHQKIQDTLKEIGFTVPTEIQQGAIPKLLERTGVDFHGQAQTGTGKTLAFGLPLLHRINTSDRMTQAIVVAPTRELALQISESLSPFARAMGVSIATIYGGVSMEQQVSALRSGVHIVVGTPGRINDHLRRGTMQLAQIKTLVLDEADIMLDMGFKEEVDAILESANKNREIWLFSATVKSGISRLMKLHMTNPVSVRVSTNNVGTSNTKQYYCVVQARSRMDALCRFIESAPEFYGFIFCQTKFLASEVADKLLRRGYRAGSLHGDMSQIQRNAVIKKFKTRDFTVVVATDVAARGIDIQDLTHVVNYSLPEDHESYVHRTGRTGRAGKDGVAITFINKSELRMVSMISRKFKVAIDQISVPSRDTIIKGRVARATEFLDRMASSAADIKEKDIHESLLSLVNKFDLDQLKTIVAHIIHEKFLDSIINEDDGAFAESSSQQVHVGSGSGNQEMMLAVGSDDGLNRDDIIAYLKEFGSIQEDQVLKIRMIRRRTFVEVAPDCAMQLFNALKNSSLAGRKTHVQLVNEDQSSPRREAGRNNFGGGGFRGRSSRPQSGGNGGGYRRERRSYAERS